MIARALIITLAALAYVFTLANAGEQVAREPGKWELRDAEGSPVKDEKGVWVRTDTEDQCVAAMRRLFSATLQPELKYRCTTAVRYTVTGVCDVAKPEPAPVDDDGFTVLPVAPEPEQCPDGVTYKLLEQRWKVAYPTCGEYETVTIMACGHVVEDVVAPEDMDEPGEPTGTVGTNPPDTGPSTWEP